MLTSTKSRIAVIAAASMMSMAAQATDITGAGSSFVYPVLTKWSAAYAEKTGNQLNYQSVGSGAGIAQIKAGTIDFGASSSVLRVLKTHSRSRLMDSLRLRMAWAREGRTSTLTHGSRSINRSSRGCCSVCSGICEAIDYS